MCCLAQQPIWATGCTPAFGNTAYSVGRCAVARVAPAALVIAACALGNTLTVSRAAL